MSAEKERYKELEKKIKSKDNSVQIKLDGIAAGSGVAFDTKNDEYRYIFTVFHVIKKWIDNKCKLEFVLQNKTFEGPKVFEENKNVCLPMEQEEIKKYLKEYDNQEIPIERDLAVIKVCKTEGMGFLKDFSCMDAEILFENQFYIGNGYPRTDDLTIELYGEYKEKKDKTIYCSVEDKVYTDFTNSMHGFSGTGLFIERGQKRILIGLVDRANSDEQNNIFLAVNILDLIHKMQKVGWDIPEIIQAVDLENDKLNDKKYDDVCNSFIKDLELASVLRVKYRQLVKNLSMQELLEKEKYYDVPKCNCKQREACPNFIVGRIFFFGLSKLLNDDYKCNYFDITENKKLTMEYICSEGSGNADIGTVTRKLVTEDILGNRIAGDSIVIWQSMQTAFLSKKSKTALRKVVTDIAGNENDENGRMGIDLLDGEMNGKDYAIIHLMEFGRKISECSSMDNVKEKVREALDELWS